MQLRVMFPDSSFVHSAQDASSSNVPKTMQNEALTAVVNM